jgi:hypothetical protein
MREAYVHAALRGHGHIVVHAGHMAHIAVVHV